MFVPFIGPLSQFIVYILFDSKGYISSSRAKTFL